MNLPKGKRMNLPGKSISKRSRLKQKPRLNPFGDKADELKLQASDLDKRVKELRDSIKRVKEAKVREPIEKEIDELCRESDLLKQKTKDEQAAGDRIYWPIYNLDIKNPNAPEAESHDPDDLLVKYKQLLLDIEETQNQLKDELAVALAHHFDEEEKG